MDLQFHLPSSPLSECVVCLMHYQGFEPDHSVERVVPTGHVFLIVELDGFERQVFENDTLEVLARYREAWISGMQRNFLSISAHQHSEMFVIQFEPAGAYPCLHRELHKFADRVVPASDLPELELERLRAELLGAPTRADKFAVGENWLRERYRAELGPPPPIADVLTRLSREPGARHGEAVARYPHTQKHLIAEFKRYLGITPKYYHRILRFNDVLRHIQSQGAASWTAIAHHCGYADQSHFIRDFRHFSGFNPGEYLREDFEGGQTNFFPLDRRG